MNDETLQKKYMRFLGFPWNKSFSYVFSRPRVLSLCDFIDRLSGSGSISHDKWDILTGNRTCVTQSSFFPLIQEIPGPNSLLFMIDFMERATVQWKVTLTCASDALLVCRLHPSFREKDIALYLVRRGIRFYTLQDLKTLPSPTARPCHRHQYKPPIRLPDHTFTFGEYVSYESQCLALLREPRFHAALLRGGYLWRVAVSNVDFQRVLAGPSGSFSCDEEMFVVSLLDGRRLVDDALTDSEIMQLMGTYHTPTGMFVYYIVTCISTKTV